MKTGQKRLLLRFVIELTIFSVLVVIYLLVVLRFFGEGLTLLYNNNLLLYAFIGLGLIVVQAAVFDLIVSAILKRLGLE
ncbi:MAG: hypothetical protein U9R25_11580 [Chloroflexota bacterium]|nr:hypothetical protein [Chloroflexota bacterium]